MTKANRAGESWLPFGSEEMGELVVLIEHTKVIADLHKDVALGERLVGDPAGILGDGIGPEQRFVHTHV